MDEAEFLSRTKSLGLRIIRLVRSLPNERVADSIGRQLLRSGTSVGANYRAACRARSTPDIIAKLKICEEEADESLYWMEVLAESETVPKTKMNGLMRECHEITAMLVASIKTLRSRQTAMKTQNNRKS